MANTLHALHDAASQEIEAILAKRAETGSLEKEHLCYLKELIDIIKDIAETEKYMAEYDSENGEMSGINRNRYDRNGMSGTYYEPRVYNREATMERYPYREDYEKQYMNKLQMAGRYM